MKRLLTSTALALALAGPAVAQSADSTAFMGEAEANALQASNLIGSRLYTSENDVGEDAMGLNENWEDVGEIGDIVFGRDGQINAVLVDIGGFLGIGEKRVAVSMDQLDFVQEDGGDSYFIVVQASREQLENAPEYGASAEGDAAMNEDMSSEGASMSAADDAENMDSAAGETDAEGGATMSAETDAEGGTDDTSEEVAEAADAAGDDMEQAAEATGDAVEDGAESAGEMAQDAGEEIEQTAEAAGEEMQDGAQAAENMAENAGEEVEQTAEAAGEEMEETAQEAENAAEEAGEETADAAGDAAQEVEQTAEAAGEEMEETAQEAENATEEAAEDTAQAAENAGEEVEQTAEAAGEEMEETAQQAENAAEEGAAEAEGELTTEAEAGSEMDEGAQTETAQAEGAMTAPQIEREGYSSSNFEELTADDVTGARVYDVNDEWIGEISEVLLTADGKVDGAVIDVGGFLGIGEKPVRMAVDSLNLQRPNDGGSVRVYISASEDELKNMPEYDAG